MITILRCGHDSHHSRPVEMEHRHGLDHYLLLLIKTEGYVEQKGQVLTAFPESAPRYGGQGKQNRTEHCC